MRRVDRSERGVVLWIVAAVMLTILIIAALVLDDGQYRQTRRANQSIADLAALAAGPKLSPAGGSDPVGACNDAVNYLRLNAADLPSAMSVPCGNLPTVCDPGNPPAEVAATATGADPYTVSVSYPVPYSDISDSRFSAEAPEDGNACQRMKVIVHRADLPTFGRVAGAGTQGVTASAVIRVFSSAPPNQVAALTVLERAACPALNTSGGGSNGQGVIVNGADASDPGRIQLDSAGIVGTNLCTNNSSNPSSFALYGTGLPSNGGPSIQAKPDSNGDPGTIQLYSLAIGGRGAYDTVAGISPVPTGGGLVSRITADNRYGSAISSLHNGAYAAAITTITGNPSTVTVSTPSAGLPGTRTSITYNVVSGNNNCSPGSNGTLTTISGDTFFNCSDFSPSGTVVLTGHHFIFAGTLTVNSQGSNTPTLSMPNANTIIVRGCSSSCHGGNNYAISASGNLYVNNGYTGATGTSLQHCSPSFAGPGEGGTYTNTAYIATFGGPISITGTVYLCQTTLYAGSNVATYSAMQQVSPYTPPTFCSTLLPCPDGTIGAQVYTGQTYSQTITITGGSGYADWSAPDQSAGLPPPGSLDQLALWEEGDSAANITGQGSNLTVGVFFAPNAPFTFTGQATQTQPLHAQFISRTLTISGQSTLYLVGPPNFVPTNPKTEITLIR